jgi:hypothetical protein
MQTNRTIRNCLPVFRFECPKLWEQLLPTDDPSVRHCGLCNRSVHYCTTDEETIAHAIVGDCIAREYPDESEQRRVFVGQPAHPLPPPTPQQEEAGRMRQREWAVDDSIKNVAYSSRSCPQCNYPAPDWRATCRVCGFEIGVVLNRVVEPTPEDSGAMPTRSRGHASPNAVEGT